MTHAVTRVDHLQYAAPLATAPTLGGVRPATVADLPRLTMLVGIFGAARDFREPFTQDPAVVRDLLLACLDPARGTVLVLDGPAGATGLLVLCFIDNPISRERLAAELVWFVQPAARGGGKALLDAAEQWATARGAVRLSLIAPSERIGRVYERWGYQETERGYTKVLAPPVAREARPDVPGVTLTPITDPEWAQVWCWLREDPAANFDDDGPHTFAAFRAERQAADPSRLWIVRLDDRSCGFVSWVPVTARLGMFQGIALTRSAAGQGIATTAVRRMLAGAWAEGMAKLSATYFAPNLRVRHLLARCGAVDEGLLTAHTTQNGVPVDVRVVALFAPRKD